MDVYLRTIKEEVEFVHKSKDSGSFEKAKELLIVNPLLYDDLDKYIWIDDTSIGHRAAQQLFNWLLRKKIYIKGFVTNVETLFHLKMYNKEIYDINILDKEASAVFCDFYSECLDINVFCEVHSARMINPDIDKKNLAIWGAGKTGECIYEILKNNGIQVKYFIDTHKNLEGTNRCGIPIYLPNQSGELTKDITVIEAVEEWKELDKNIQRRYEKRFFFDSGRIGEGIVYDDGMKKERMFCLESFWMFNHFVGKRVYIYGFGAAEKEFAEYLKLLDYDFVGFLVDEIDSIGEQVGDYVQYVEEILLEDNFYIWVYDKKKAKKLNEFGLKYFKDYYVKDYRFDVTINQKTILDINLGNNYLADSKYPGVMIYGDEKEDDFKIAVLGGSTTDGTMYPFKSWPQLLHEELGEGNITIYNGGVCSYTSGQELIKLVRDILQLRPDMLIVYDGYNDLAFNSYPQYPFSFLYLEKVVEYAKVHMEDEEDIAYMDEKGVFVCRGIESGQSRFDNWMSNIRAMHAIAAENDISFFSFCQPTLYSKKRTTFREKNMLISTHNATISLFRNESFRKHMTQGKNMPDYMYDLSHIFDEEDDVYMDACHVWEKGNSIIARVIKNIIFSEVKVSKSNNDIGRKF